jgi:aryl-phospho-beta-D-glucosidase BglC (GH1 family)
MLRLSTSGKNIVDSTGSTVRLKSVNWFGAQSTNMCPDGLWSVSYQSILTNIKSFGFNCIRMPICVDFCQSGAMPTSINTYANPALAGLNAVQVMQTVVSYAGSLSLYVYLDMHRFNGGAGTDSDINSTTIGSIVSAWQTMATAFGSNSTVIGCDVYNEPYTLDWPTFASYAVTIGNAVHAIAPDWLIIVEGVGGTGTGGIPGFWWGGNLTGVSTHPVVLSASNKVVYSPHEYGQSVGAQSWLETTSQVVSLYPTNLPSIWNPSWGFINEDNIAPILIGEFGGKLGYTGSGSTDSTQVNATYEQEWLAELASYVNTYGMSFTYWAYNPNSGDTGGLMCDDWVTPQLGKLALLSSLI